jgi:hypothetical protein
MANAFRCTLTQPHAGCRVEKIIGNARAGDGKVHSKQNNLAVILSNGVRRCGLREICVVFIVVVIIGCSWYQVTFSHQKNRGASVSSLCGLGIFAGFDSLCERTRTKKKRQFVRYAFENPDDGER